MTDTKRLYKLYIGESIVFGPHDNFPKLSEYQSIVIAHKSSLTHGALSALAYQTVAQSSPKLLPQYLNILSCVYWTSDISQLGKLTDSGEGAKVCGRIFKRGEIVWTCKQCGLDPTCVQCDACFKSSDHTGHDVYFHKSGAGGGCCDCGDPEAWKTAGNCPHHGKADLTAEAVDARDPTAELPVELADGAAATTLGVVMALVDFAVKSVRGFEPVDMNPFLQDSAPDAKLCLRLFNDDFHTYEEVGGALRLCGLSANATDTMTSLVDKVGSAKIATGNAEELRKKYEKLRPRLHLLVSIIPESVAALEGAAASLANWLQEFGAHHDGLRRIVTNAFIARIDQLPPAVTSAVKGSTGDGRVGDAYLDPLEDMISGDSSSLFPLNIPILDCRPTPSIRGGRNPLVFKTADIGSLGTDVLARHAEIRCGLAILMAASHFLPKPLEECLGELFVGNLRDDVFKPAYTQLLTMLYPVLHKQFCVGLGTSELSVLRTTCQVYTANSLTMLMSSADTAQRVFVQSPDLPPIHISTVLMQSAVQCLRLSGIANSVRPPGHSKEYELSFVLSHHRFRQSLRDIDYVMTCPDFVLRVLSGELDPGSVDIFLKYCQELAGIDSYKCIRTGAHVEREEMSWQAALEIALELENTSSEFLDYAFLLNRDDNDENPARVVKQIKVLTYLVGKTIAVLQETWEGACLSMTPFPDGKTLVTTGLENAVSAREISIHNTVEKFLAKCLVTAAKGGLDFCLKDFAGVYGFMLAEKAIRSFAFVAQVKGQIWVRNGMSPLNIAHNYEFPPVSLMFQDAEIHVLQIALHAYSDKKLFLNTARYIFEIAGSPIGDLNAVPLGSDTVFGSGKVSIHLASALLRMLILMMTHVPVDFMSNDRKGIRTALRKEVLHLLLSGLKSRGPLQKAKALVGCPDTLISEQLLSSVISDLCEASSDEGGADGGPAMLTVKSKCILEYDPEFNHTMPKKQQASFEMVAETRKTLQRDLNSRKAGLPQVPWPVVSHDTIRSPHAAFESTRTLLYSSAFVDFLTFIACSVLPGESEKSLKPGGQVVVARVIYLVTLQLHCFSETATTVRRLQSLPQYDDDAEHHREVLEFESDSVAHSEGSMSRLLSVLADIFGKGLISADEFYQEGLDFVLSEYSKRSAHIRSMCDSKGLRLVGLSTSSSTAVKSGGDSLKRRRDEAMSKAMYSMRKRAAQFFEANDMALPKALSASLTLTDTVNSQTAGASPPDGNTGEVGSATTAVEADSDEIVCIVCRESASLARPCGYLSQIQSSSALANVLKHSTGEPGSTDMLLLNTVFRVVASKGANVMSSPNEKADVVATVEHGKHVTVAQRLNGSKWVEVTAPVSGWCVMYLTVPTCELEADVDEDCAQVGSLPASAASAAAASTAERGGLVASIGSVWRRQLGGLFSNPATSEDDSTDDVTVLPVLFPIKELTFSKFGAHKPHVSTCGHAMHFSCYDDFYSASIAKRLSDAFMDQIMSQDNSFRCPMCNYIGNALLPDDNCEKTFCEVGLSHADGITDSSGDTPLRCCVSTFSDGGDDTSSSIVNSSKIRVATFLEQLYSSCQSRSPFVKNSFDDATPRVLQRRQFLHLQAGWTSAAHTLLLAVCNRRWESDESPSSDERLESLRVSMQDLRIAGKLINFLKNVHTVYDSKQYNEHVLESLRVLIFGLNDYSVPGDTEMKAVTLGPDIPKNVWKSILLNLPNSVIASSTFEFRMNHEAVASVEAVVNPIVTASEMWSFLKQPLLAHDLHVMIIATVTNAHTGKQNIIRLIQVLCMARLAQIFIEPTTCQKYISSSSQGVDRSALSPISSGSLFYDSMKAIRRQCGIAVSEDCGSPLLEYTLVSIVLDLMLPFLEYCYNILLAFDAENATTPLCTDISTDKKQSATATMYGLVVTGNPKYAIVPALLDTFRLPDLDVILFNNINNTEVGTGTRTTTAFGPYVQKWCADFRLFYANKNDSIINPFDSIVPKKAVTPAGVQPQRRIMSPPATPDDGHISSYRGIQPAQNGTALSSESEDDDDDDDNDGDSDGVLENPPFNAARDAMDLVNELAEAGMMEDLLADDVGFGEESDENYESDDSAGERRLFAITGGSKKKAGWPFIGIDPSYDCVDQSASKLTPIHSPFLGSISGTHAVYDKTGERLLNGYFDQSTFSMRSSCRAAFIELPMHYTELYQQYKLPDVVNGVEERRTTAICLVCGQILQAGNRESASASGGYLSPEDCKCLLVNGPLQMYAPSVYVTADGETSDVRHSTRPLYLSSRRVQKLEQMYFKQKIASEVCHKRSTDTHVIRSNYY